MKTSIAILMLLSVVCHAQDSTTNYTQKYVWRALILTPGITHEVRLGPKITFVPTLQLGGGFVASGTRAGTLPGNSSGFYSSYYLNVVASAEGRYYYNIAKRLQQGKSINANSANYLSIGAISESAPFTEQYLSSIELARPDNDVGLRALWGLQRTYRRNFYLNLAAGVGVSTRGTGFAGSIQLGYTLPTRKR
ncbi:hypothetical protein [Spirosoma fluviale]|uniref:Outer membrane protein beta-barrel domain-containing protein n=1 Tax=Spirosoma fluviale TaxID=1597977 RepID=A0A286FXZ2_9BACT|nr:hypothetical protein [Spirosoma fluviale]SOD88113.1 hypothetical protein SAMN06269250_2504 [Spirosoma fluviale]